MGRLWETRGCSFNWDFERRKKEVTGNGGFLSIEAPSRGTIRLGSFTCDTKGYRDEGMERGWCLRGGPVCILERRSFTGDLTGCKRRLSIWRVSLCGNGIWTEKCFTRKSEIYVRLVKGVFVNSASLYGGLEGTWIEGSSS